MTAVKRVFIVDGKPFLPLGSEFLTQSGYSVRDTFETEEAFRTLKFANGNAAEFPVYWDQVEPEEGRLDFSSVDTLISLARKYEVKLILLWFATWKNGNMDFAPAWVKNNPQRFKREKASDGKDLWVLSSHCPATLEADKKAFIALSGYLKAKDSVERTVIGIQVENEPNITDQDHDYAPEAVAVFNGPVPAELISRMKAAGKGEVYDAWQKVGDGKESGTWPELFGQSAGPISHTWGLATYINAVAKAGKAVYNLPMFINIAGPGRDAKVLDIWKWFTPDVDMIGPDLYIPATGEYNIVAAKYSRDDNPLFVPESFGDLNMLYAVADYNAVGYFCYIRMNQVYGDSMARPDNLRAINLIKCVSSIMPLILKYQGTGKIHAVVQPENEEVQRFDFDCYTGIVEFGDWRPAWVARNPPDNSRGAGLVIQSGRNEFYLSGHNCRLHLNAKPPYDKVQAPKANTVYKYGVGVGHTISVEEGHFNSNGEFIADRRRNGDETYHGAWVESNIGVVRVIMCDC
jgi:hypothetical protein